MRIRYPIATLLVILASLAAAWVYGSIWPMVAGFWLGCLPGLMAIVDYEQSIESGSGQRRNNRLARRESLPA